MKKLLFLFFVSPVFFVFGGVKDVPEVLPETMRPVKGSELPVDLRRRDWFGRVKNPRSEAYDPFNSPLLREGRDATAEMLPDGRVLADLSHRHVVRYGSLPTVAVTAGRAVSVLLMREGRILRPSFAGIVPPPEDIVQVITVKDSPYLYFQAVEGAVFPETNFRYTHVFIPLELEGRPVQFQIRLKVVRPSSVEVAPMVILDMVGEFPDVFKERVSESPGVSPVSPVFLPGAPGVGLSAFQGVNPVPVEGVFARGDIERYLPTMVEMAKLYDRAVYDRAPGYAADNIIRFLPRTVNRGEVVSGTVPGFRNPLDEQVYWVPRGYYFPEYDAVLYEMVVKNVTSGDLWWDYSLLRVLFGFEESGDRSGGARRTIVVPDPFEVVPSGRSNTLWVLAQGNGVFVPNTPVRFLFPASGGAHPGVSLRRVKSPAFVPGVVETAGRAR